MYDINKEVSIYKVVIYDSYYMFEHNIEPVIIFYLYSTDVQNEEGIGVLGEYTTIECIMVKPNCLEHRSAIRNHHYVNMSNNHNSESKNSSNYESKNNNLQESEDSDDSDENVQNLANLNIDEELENNEINDEIKIREEYEKIKEEEEIYRKEREDERILQLEQELKDLEDGEDSNSNSDSDIDYQANIIYTEDEEVF